MHFSHSLFLFLSIAYPLSFSHYSGKGFFLFMCLNHIKKG
ncbi:hypothetical protein US8_01390 [Bacillus altitudinis]|nr:hypothetical protein US8_01390 [Bacillus altitudinis]